MESSVKTLGLVMPGRGYPQLQFIEYDENERGELVFRMVWQSIETPYRYWNDPQRLKKYDTFFGPGVWSKVIKVSAEKKMVGIELTIGDKPAEEIEGN